MVCRTFREADLKRRRPADMLDFDMMDRLTGDAANSNGLCVDWSQNELERVLGVNSPGALRKRPRGRRGGRRECPPSASAASLFLRAVCDAVSRRWLSVYGMLAIFLLLLKIYAT